MRAHEEYREMLPAQGLGALDAADAHSLAEHLEICAACRQELKTWEATATSLTFAANPMAPSTQLRERILEAVRADAVSSNPSSRAFNSTTTPPLTTNVIPLPVGRRSSPIPVWAAIAASLVFLAMLGSLFVVWQQNKVARQELARLSEEVREAREQMARQREAMEIVTAPGARMSELAGTKEMPGAHGMVAYDKNGRAILMAKGLPPPPAGKAYQLWFIAGGKPMPGKVFMTDASGTGSVMDDMPAEAMSGAVFAITLEPSGGVQAPTGKIYLSSQS